MGRVTDVRQISHSECVKGSTWGRFPGGIWVDHGCRAIFEIESRGRHDPRAGLVSCASHNGRFNHCPADLRGRRVRLAARHSHAECRRGESWGTDRQGIWVDRGCRADFAIGDADGSGDRPRHFPPLPPEPRPGRRPRGGVVADLVCASTDRRLLHCEAPVRGNRVVLTKQISRAPCERGQTWGVKRNAIWVDDGCRARFRILRGGPADEGGPAEVLRRVNPGPWINPDLRERR
jgi:hypothetical protein